MGDCSGRLLWEIAEGDCSGRLLREIAEGDCYSPPYQLFVSLSQLFEFVGHVGSCGVMWGDVLGDMCVVGPCGWVWGLFFMVSQRVGVRNPSTKNGCLWGHVGGCGGGVFSGRSERVGLLSRYFLLGKAVVSYLVCYLRAPHSLAVAQF